MPNSASGALDKGRVLLDLRHYGEQNRNWNRPRRLDPGAADCWYLLGLISRRPGDTDESIR